MAAVSGADRGVINTGNHTKIDTVILLGFHICPHFKIPFFLLICFLFGLTLAGNTMIVALVVFCPNLHHPMYFFLSNLSVSDIMLTTSIVPIMLCAVLRGGVTLSIESCITQLLIFCIALPLESLLLAVMSLDRYLAICNPLRYTIIMDKKLLLQLVILCWFLSVTVVIITAVMVSKLTFCGSNVIDHFFCDFFPLLKLSCSDTSALETAQIIVAAPAALGPILLIIVTYIYIFITVLRIPSRSGKQKTFSTVSSHLTVVCTFYGSLISLYIVPSEGNSLTANKILSLLYSVVTPLFNPIIYSLRNQEIRMALKKYLCGLRLCRQNGRLHTH